MTHNPRPRSGIVELPCLHAIRVTTTNTVACHQATSLVLLKHPSHNVIVDGEQASHTLAECVPVSPGKPISHVKPLHHHLA